jgi:hypothetical protein
MGTLLQLMALPAACMLLTWARHGGASAVVTALCRLVATAAVRRAAYSTLTTPAGANPTAKIGKSVRLSLPAAASRLGPSKDAQAPRNPPLLRGSGDASPRLRRMRPRWANGSVAT